MSPSLVHIDAAIAALHPCQLQEARDILKSMSGVPVADASPRIDKIAAAVVPEGSGGDALKKVRKVLSQLYTDPKRTPLDEAIERAAESMGEHADKFRRAYGASRATSNEKERVKAERVAEKVRQKEAKAYAAAEKRRQKAENKAARAEAQVVAEHQKREKQAAKAGGKAAAKTEKASRPKQPTAAQVRKLDKQARASAREDIDRRACSFRPSEITVDPDRPGARPVDLVHATRIAESIRLRGLDIPIEVKERYENDAKGVLGVVGASLSKGLHRLTAWMLVHGDKPIPCLTISYAMKSDGSDALPIPDEITVELSALEDNALRLELSPHDRAKHTARIAELMREAAQHVPPDNREPTFIPPRDEKKKKGRPKKADSVSAVTAEIQKKTKKSRSAVHRDLQRARGEKPTPRKPAAAPAAQEPPTPPQPAQEAGQGIQEPQEAAPAPAQEPREPIVTTDALSYRQALRTFKAWRADHGHLKCVQNAREHPDAVEEGLESNTEAAVVAA
jgi:hypothetical protein